MELFFGANVIIIAKSSMPSPAQSLQTPLPQGGLAANDEKHDFPEPADPPDIEASTTC